MMVGNRYYSDADLMRMQRDAEERVREMRNRTRQTADAESGGSFIPAFANPNRNWDSSPSTYRNRNRGGARNRTGAWQGGEQISQQYPPREEEIIREGIPDTGQDTGVRDQPPPPADAPPVEETPHSTGGKKTTIVEDVVGSLGLDADTLLIVGLILILINQKADTTLILALAYLLI